MPAINVANSINFIPLKFPVYAVKSRFNLAPPLLLLRQPFSNTPVFHDNLCQCSTNLKQEPSSYYSKKHKYISHFIHLKASLSQRNIINPSSTITSPAPAIAMNIIAFNIDFPPLHQQTNYSNSLPVFCLILENRSHTSYLLLKTQF